MTELEVRLRSAMHAAVDTAEPPDGLAAAVQRRYRRHVLRVAAAAAAVIALLVAVPVALAAGFGSAPTTSGSGHHHRAGAPARLRGAPARSVPRLLLDGPRPAYYNPATRRSEPIAGLPRVRLGYSFTRIASGWLAEPNNSAPACCAGPALPVYYLADGSRSAVFAGSGYAARPAAAAGQLWLLTYRSRTQRLAHAVASARLATVAGQPAGAEITLPAGYQIVRAVGRDLLLTPAIKLPWPVKDELWDPAAKRVVRVVPGVVAASQAVIAWEPAGLHGVVHVLNVLTGAGFTARLPAGTRAYFGTISADGRFLAMALATSTAQGSLAVRTSLAVVDIQRRALLSVPGSTVTTGVSDQLAFGWQPGGDRLIAALPQGSSKQEQWIQVATWRPGAAALLVATVPIPGGRWVVLGDHS